MLKPILEKTPFVPKKRAQEVLAYYEGTDAFACFDSIQPWIYIDFERTRTNAATRRDYYAEIISFFVHELIHFLQYMSVGCSVQRYIAIRDKETLPTLISGTVAYFLHSKNTEPYKKFIVGFINYNKRINGVK